MRVFGKLLIALGLFALAACGEKPAEDGKEEKAKPVAAKASPGISDNEILIGTHQDLSGPISAWGAAARNGMELAVEEINEAGGIHGRKMRLITEDTAYDPKKAVLAVQKLVNRDGVFAIIGGLGTATSVASMPIALNKGVLHLFPTTAAEQTYKPFHELKFSSFTPYYYGMAITTKHLHETQGIRKIGILHQDDDFGLNAAKGVELAIHELGLEEPVVTTYKRGATDFTTQIAKLNSEGVDAVALGSIIRETAGAVKAAREMGWDVPIYCPVACYTPETLAIGGETMNGVITNVQVPIPYADDPNPKMGEWITKYESRFNATASSQAMIGYNSIYLFAAAAEFAGRDLTTESFKNALEDMPVWSHPDFGGIPIDFTDTDHLGAKSTFLARAENGKWVIFTDLLGKYWEEED